MIGLLGVNLISNSKCLPIVANQRLIQLAEFLQKELAKEIILQKHKATGRLLNEMEVQVIEEATRTIIRETHPFYGDFVDRGRKPGGRRVPIDALERWVRVKGFAPGRERGAAFAIQRKIFKEGIPTNGSRKLAPRRTAWLTGVVERNRQKIEAEINEAVRLGFEVEFRELLKEVNEIIAKQG